MSEHIVKQRKGRRGWGQIVRNKKSLVFFSYTCSMLHLLFKNKIYFSLQKFRHGYGVQNCCKVVHCVLNETEWHFICWGWGGAESQALQRKSHLCIPFLGIARRVPISTCMCLWGFTYSQDRSTYFDRSTDRPWEYINPSQAHECGNWDCGRAIPFLFVSNCRYWFFAVSNTNKKWPGQVVHDDELEERGVDEEHAGGVPHVHGRQVRHNGQVRPEPGTKHWFNAIIPTYCIKKINMDQNFLDIKSFKKATINLLDN
jgi:hypothetical protein